MNRIDCNFSARDHSDPRLTDATPGDRGRTVLEAEVFGAIRKYKRSAGREFPSWDEVVGVLRGLGRDVAAG